MRPSSRRRGGVGGGGYPLMALTMEESLCLCSKAVLGLASLVLLLVIAVVGAWSCFGDDKLRVAEATTGNMMERFGLVYSCLICLFFLFLTFAKSWGFAICTIYISLYIHLYFYFWETLNASETRTTGNSDSEQKGRNNNYRYSGTLILKFWLGFCIGVHFILMIL